MEHKPATTFIVSVFDKPRWRTILTTKDRAEAEALGSFVAPNEILEAALLN